MPFGQAFKIGGYTMAGGEGWLSKIPPAGMILSSFTHTNKSQPGDATPHFGRNDNFVLDQLSLFLAGRLTDYVSVLVQGTYNTEFLRS